MYNKEQKVKSNSSKELIMKTIAKIIVSEGYRDELIKGQNGTYYRIKRVRKGDAYKLYKITNIDFLPEHNELLGFRGLTLKEAYNEVKRLEK